MPPVLLHSPTLLQIFSGKSFVKSRVVFIFNSLFFDAMILYWQQLHGEGFHPADFLITLNDDIVFVFILERFELKYVYDFIDDISWTIIISAFIKVRIHPVLNSLCFSLIGAFSIVFVISGSLVISTDDRDCLPSLHLRVHTYRFILIFQLVGYPDIALAVCVKPASNLNIYF